MRPVTRQQPNSEPGGVVTNLVTNLVTNSDSVVTEPGERGYDKDSLALPDHSAILQVMLWCVHCTVTQVML